MAGALCGLLAWWCWPREAPAPLVSPAPAQVARALPEFDTVAPAAPAEPQRVPLAPVDARAPAWHSMAIARQQGDARSPPLARADAAAPQAADLADPAAFRRYETGQDARMKAAFVAAAEQALPQLRADVARARQEGIAAREIAQVEEKIRRIPGPIYGVATAFRVRPE